MTGYATANERFHIDRYLEAEQGPSDAQYDALLATFTGSLPSDVKTIQDAIGFVLGATGYQLMPFKKMSEQLQILMMQPLSESQRTYKQASIESILNVLSGPAYQLLVDPVHHHVSFKLKGQYEAIYQVEGEDHA